MSNKSAFQLTEDWMSRIGHIPSSVVELGSSKFDFHMRLIEEEYTELQEAIEASDKRGVVDALGDLTVVLNNLLVAFHIDGDALAKEIYDSNISKFCYTTQEAVDTVNKYRSEGVETDLYYCSLGKYYIVKRADTGKVLKSVNFKEPDLERFLCPTI